MTFYKWRATRQSEGYQTSKIWKNGREVIAVNISTVFADSLVEEHNALLEHYNLALQEIDILKKKLFVAQENAKVI